MISGQYSPFPLPLEKHKRSLEHLACISN
uniref:Uncharacterized protein n=1 Tax=Rhizophora mucronata TaxID=61149 RepID=A0A2P2Q097_RHIMU